jgi:hypothetical protein
VHAKGEVKQVEQRDGFVSLPMLFFKLPSYSSAGKGAG